MTPLRLFAFGTLAALALGACERQAAPSPESNPDAKPGLSASGGELVLPAVRGRPAAAYFKLTNTGPRPATLAAVSVARAERAEMHETAGGSMKPLTSLELKPGQTAAFARGGKHVMVFGLAPETTASGTVEMTLTFADGDKLSTPLQVKAAGAASEEHDGHDGH